MLINVPRFAAKKWMFELFCCTGSLLGPGTLRFFIDNWPRYFSIMVPGFFPIDNGFFTYDIIREADEGKWWVRCIFSCLFCLLMFVDAFTIAITVVWVYARWNIKFALHLRQFIPYGHFHPFSCLNCSRLMKGLNNYNVTEWDNWFVCVAVETCDKKKFIFGPGYFSMRPGYFSTVLAHGIFLLKVNWCVCCFFFLTLYLWKSVLATF